MRIASALHWTLVVALLGACSRPHSSESSSIAAAATDARAQLRFETEVRAIFEDTRGNFWIGSAMEGVAQFDGEDYTYFTVDDGLPHNQIRRILEDRNGVVWFEGGEGISSYDGKRIIAHTSRDYTSKDNWKLETGDLWFKEDQVHGHNELEGQPGVYRYDGETFTYLAFPLGEVPAGSYASTGMAQGSGGRLWFATYDAVIGFDGESFTIIDGEQLGIEDELFIRSVFEDSRGRLWIGDRGLGVFLLEGDTIVNFTQQNRVGRRKHRRGGRMRPLPGDAADRAPSLSQVFSIGEDRAGSIWFGTLEQGAWRYDGTSLQHFSEDDGLITKEVSEIYTDRRGDLWLGGHGVFRFNGESFDRIH